MGYYGRIELKRQAQELRRKGRSYNSISEKLHLSKSTISDWCKDVPLTQGQIHKLYENKKTGALKGSIIAAKLKQKKRRMVTEELFEKGKREVGNLISRDRFIAGVAFYASEGTKSDKGCAFANANPAIIQFMVNWFREFGKVSNDKFRAAIWLHEGLSEGKAKEFWSKITGIPVDHFYKTYIAQDKKNSNKIRKNIHEFGVFTFYVSDVILARTIMGWIGGILQM